MTLACIIEREEVTLQVPNPGVVGAFMDVMDIELKMDDDHSTIRYAWQTSGLVETAV